MKTRKAVVLLSGGLDSATTLAMAVAEGFRPYTLSFSYGQRHTTELRAAERIARRLEVVEHRVIQLDLRVFGGSALTDDAIPVPTRRSEDEIGHGIPITYVPGRNTIFLSFAIAWAEVLGSRDVFIGINAVDYSGYPDCRPEYLTAFERMAQLATRAGAERGEELSIHAPLMSMSKAEIIRRGEELGVDYSVTVTCYAPTPKGEACGICDACFLRLQGFSANGLRDPAPYVEAAV